MAASRSSIAAARLVFALPELLGSIFYHLTRSDLAKVMRLSRFCFACAGALVWKDLTGVTKLLSLIPGTKVRSSRRGVGLQPRVITIKLPESSDFHRFERYAPFIKTLEIPDCYQLSGAQVLRAYRDTRQNGVLPNLTSLTCRYGEAHTSTIVLKWVEFFLCHSLQTLLVIPITKQNDLGPWKDLKPAQASRLLRDLPQKCPNLCEIQVIASSETDLLKVKAASIYEPLVAFPCLRRVNGSQILLESRNMELLGSLPDLEYLTIHSNMRETHCLKTSWPMNHFPKMHCLHLSDLRPETISSLWTIGALIEKLSELDIRFSDYVSNIPHLSEWTLAFIRNLPLRSAHITTLTFALHSYFTETIKLSIPDLQSLQKLPLQSLSFYRVVLGQGTSHEDLTRAIPGIRILRLSSLCPRSSDLLCYASNLRSLEVLSIAIDFDPDFPVDKASHVPITHKVLLENPNLVFPESRIHQVARQLYGLWPGVQCVVTKKRMQLGRSNPALCEELNKAIVRCRHKFDPSSVHS